MGILVSVLAGLVAGEAGVLWYLWKRWQAAEDTAALNDTVARMAQVAYGQATNDLAVARRALAEHNKVENADDKARVDAAPGLDDAISRINGVLRAPYPGANHPGASV